MRQGFLFHPIGRVRGNSIQMHKRWVKGLEGIEKFSHIIVLFWLHKAKKPEMLIHPKGFKELPRIGFMATRTPHRPNPVGMTMVKLLRRRGSRLLVEGLDAWDNTPVLDVKPYTKKESVKKFRIPSWVRQLDKLEKDPLRRYGS